MISRETPPERKTDIIQAALAQLTEALPSDWMASADFESQAVARGIVDAVVSLEAPEQPPVKLAVEVKRRLLTGDVPTQVARLRARLAADEGLRPALVARYLAPSTRERLAQADVSYLDATGNIRIQAKRPAMFVLLAGANSDPWRRGRPRGSLKGAPAARVVRALVDYAPPYSVPELVERSGASTGATYRVVKYLENEGLLEREERGAIHRIAWRSLLERWSTDYGFDDAKEVRPYLDPRGIARTLERLRRVPTDSYVITGSVAAQIDAPYAPPRLLTLYVKDFALPDQHLDLRPVAKGANVRVAANDDDFTFERRRDIDGLSYAAQSQVAVDLLTGPGRSPGEAEELLTWMERHEDDWRR